MKKLILSILSISTSLIIVNKVNAQATTVFTINNDSTSVNSAGTDNHNYPYVQGEDWDYVATPPIVVKNISGVTYDLKVNILSQSYPLNDTTKWALLNGCVGTTCYPNFQFNSLFATNFAPNQQADVYLHVAAPKNGANGTAVIVAEIFSPYQTDTVVFLINKTTTSINKLTENDNRISMFPNPVTTTLNVNLTTSLNVRNIRLINAIGQTVTTSSVAINQDKLNINTSNLTNGMYLVQFVDQDNKVVSTKRFLKN